MPKIEIRRFSPDDTDEVRTALAIRNAVSAEDTPWDRVELEGHFVASLRHGWDGEPATYYLMRVDGVPVGVGSVSLTERENTHLAWLSASILPDHRRQGYGSALFEQMVEEAKAAGRTSIGADGWDSERSLAFAAKYGLEKKSQAIMRRQHLSEIDRETLEKLFAEASHSATDYELVRMEGRTPVEMLEEVTALSATINDAPTDDLDIEDDVFTVDRIRDYEDAVLSRGTRFYRLVARHRETGELAGHTVIAVEVERPSVGHQHDTAVARAHRGHRLGLLVKAGMLLWLAEVEPELEQVDTWNAESNDHMIAVNEALGYRVMGRELQFQKSL
jgi:GNAT superfamily N-acetyltransferase